MDGSGKTTQMHRLAARLRDVGRTVIETIEPGGPPIAQQIRRILLDAANQELSPTTAVLLHFPDPPVAPQGGGRGLGAQAGMTRARIACRGLKPDLTILVDVDPESSLARAR